MSDQREAYAQRVAALRAPPPLTEGIELTMAEAVLVERAVADEPDSVDLLFFGIVQCHSSIPVPTLYALQSDP